MRDQCTCNGVVSEQEKTEETGEGVRFIRSTAVY